MSTVGQELEWADVDRRWPVPEHLGVWSDADYTIVNSDGHANCPTGETWQWGGEINTRPTDTPEEQGEIVRQLAELYQPTINYKCNLHVHVRDERLISPVGMRGDSWIVEQGSQAAIEHLSLLKRVATRMREAELFVYSVVEPIHKPTTLEFPDPEELRGAILRYRRNLTSHHYSLPENRWIELMAASSHREFYDAHAPASAGGGRLWHIAPRPGMNLRSLTKHGTIEYRHFPGTADPEESVSAVRWCQLFTEEMIRAASTGEDGAVAAQRLYYTRGPWRFPRFRRYDHALHQGFERTRYKK